MNQDPQRKRTLVIVAIAISVGLLHFITGEAYAGPFPLFVNDYLIDILLPAALYFLLSSNEIGPLKHWALKAAIILAIGFTVETLQYFGVPLFGRTFDPLDYLAYIFGVALAIVLDKNIFPRLFSFWENEEHQRIEAA